ncbi:MAG: hypothetical protein EPN85_14480 [Bacteroidetes bacterium]|nr:MAG: hypothetical protein EPN85_14480 [Bacteroidota bacterium]
MKKIITLSLFLLSLNMYAQRAFVRQNGTSHIYYQIDSVFFTARTGDTIYLPGGGFQINNLFIDSSITIIGAGHYPDSTQATYATTLSGNIYLKNNASFGSISGIYLTGSIIFGNSPANQTVTNYSIARCNVAGIQMGYNQNLTGTASYIIVKENIVRGWVRVCNAQFVSIENNLINADVSLFNGNISVKNNTFLGGGGCPAYCIATGSNATVENNIAILVSGCGVIGISSDVYSGIFTNNVFNIPLSFPVGSNIGSGNYTNISFTNFFVNETDYTIDYSSDYHLQNPATYLGNDGTQVGMYGTANPYKAGAVPANPHIRSKIIAPYTDNNGDLNINITVGAQDK